MATNDFKPFATGGLANVITQVVYAAAAYLPIGRGSGILPSNVYNKIARQSSVAAYLLGQLVVDLTGRDALDDGDTATLLANLKLALAAPTTGDWRHTIKLVADPGWLMMNDGTIGSATSGANYQNADAQPLFNLLFANVTDAFAPLFTSTGVPTTRGAQGSAAAAWAANCRMSLTKVLGRVLGVAGNGAGLSARALGQILGEETHLQTLDEMVPHVHPDQGPIQAAGSGGLSGNLAGGGAGTNTGLPVGQGAQIAFNVMQPTGFVNVMIKK